MAEPKLTAYSVCLSFAAGGPLIVNTMVAPDAASAAAATMLQFCRTKVPEQELMGVAVGQIETEWLRWALRTIDEGKPHEGAVVSLVSDNLRVPEVAPWGSVYRGESMCPVHPNANVFGGVCPECQKVATRSMSDMPEPA